MLHGLLGCSPHLGAHQCWIAWRRRRNDLQRNDAARLSQGRRAGAIGFSLADFLRPRRREVVIVEENGRPS